MPLRVTQQPAWVNYAFDSPQTSLLLVKSSVTQQETVLVIIKKGFMKILSNIPRLLFLVGCLLILLTYEIGGTYHHQEQKSYGLTAFGLAIAAGLAFLGAGIAYRTEGKGENKKVD